MKNLVQVIYPDESVHSYVMESDERRLNVFWRMWLESGIMEVVWRVIYLKGPRSVQ